MKVGDLVMTKRGNLAILTWVGFTHVDLFYCGTGFHRTGFPQTGILKEVKNEGR